MNNNTPLNYTTDPQNTWQTTKTWPSNNTPNYTSSCPYLFDIRYGHIHQSTGKHITVVTTTRCYSPRANPPQQSQNRPHCWTKNPIDLTTSASPNKDPTTGTRPRHSTLLTTPPTEYHHSWEKQKSKRRRESKKSERDSTDPTTTDSHHISVIAIDPPIIPYCSWICNEYFPPHSCPGICHGAEDQIEKHPLAVPPSLRKTTPNLPAINTYFPHILHIPLCGIQGMLLCLSFLRRSEPSEANWCLAEE